MSSNCVGSGNYHVARLLDLLILTSSGVLCRPYSRIVWLKHDLGVAITKPNHETNGDAREAGWARCEETTYSDREQMTCRDTEIP